MRFGKTVLKISRPRLEDIDDALQDYVRQKKEKVPDADFSDFYDVIVIGGGAIGLSTRITWHIGAQVKFC